MAERRVVSRRAILTTTNVNKPNKQPKRKVVGKTMMKMIFYILIVSALVYAVVVSSLFRVTTIRIVGNQTLNEDVLRTQIQSIISGSSLSQNILFVPVDQIDKQLRANNYQIANVSVERNLLNTITVKITEQKPSILWQSGNTISIITEDGRAYVGEPNNELKQTLPTVVDTTNLPVKAGEKVVLPSFTSFVNSVNTDLPQKGVEISKLHVEDTTTELVVTTKTGYIIRFDTTRPYGEQIADLTAVLDQLKKQGKNPAQYIDLRINSKVFYK